MAPVIPKGSARTARRPASRRFLDSFIADTPKDVVGSVAMNVVVPKVKTALYESAMAFIHGMLFGSGGSPSGSSLMQGTVLRGGQTVFRGSTDYNAISSNSVIQAASAAGNVSGPYQDLVVGTQQMAEALLAGMFDLLNQYRVVTVADLYESASISPEPQHNNFGWYSLDGARIVKELSGFRLMLPKPTRV